MTAMLRDLSAGLTSLVSRAQASLVTVANGPGGAGSGVVWSSEGLIITNAHVVHRPAPRVTLPGGRVETARVLAYDPARDLALLSVPARGLAAMPLGDSQHLQPGQWVVALGHPWGVANSATAGIIIGVGADLPGVARDRREWLMVSLVLRPGNSGGPLVDAEGRLMGINTIMTGPAVGGAVPVHVVKAFLSEATLA